MVKSAKLFVTLAATLAFTVVPVTAAQADSAAVTSTQTIQVDGHVVAPDSRTGCC
jgi:hypothetical protein